MSLTPLTSYKTLSDKRLLEAFNDAMTAVDANFTYTLGQVASPIPSLTGVTQNSVIAVGQAGSNSILEYKNPNDLINLQSVFSSYTSTNPKINLTGNLEFSINTINGPFSNFSVTSRALAGAGSINNYMKLTQLSTSGELEENHVVSAFSLASNSINIVANTGYVELNKLQIANYKFPNTAGTQGQILRLGASNVLEFATPSKEIHENTSNYYFNNNKPLLLNGDNEDQISLGFYDLDSGIGTSPNSAIENQEIFFKFRNSRILTMTKPINPSVGSPNSSYLKLESPVAIPNAVNLTAQTAYEGSLWYDSLNKSLVLVTNQGRVNIRGQSGVNSNLVNTEEAKTFNFNSAASIALGSGSNNAPALKIGNLGLTASGQEATFIFGATPSLKITNTSLESAVQANGTAKIIFDANLGINNPLNPPYTFSGATQLGLYRSATSAIGVTVQGTCVTEFTNNGIDLKTKKLFNLATPTGPLEAANKAYVDSLLPIGSIANSVPIYSTASNKYVQSDIKYVAGALQIGSNSFTGAATFKTVNNGAVTLKAPEGNQNVTFILPNNILNNGILRVNADGTTYWDSLGSLISGLLKTDGSVQMTGGIRMASATTKTNPLIGIETTGMYAAEGLTPKIGFASAGNQLLEIDAVTKTLTGASSSERGPYVRLITANDNTPVYGFAESQNSGLASTANGVALLVSGAQKLTVAATGVSVHSQKITNLAAPTVNNDAANKAYVDSATGLIEVSFRITQLPIGWIASAPIRLSLFDKALVFNDSAITLPFECSIDPSTISIPENFNTNAKCQCYVNNDKLIKMPNDANIRQVARFNSSSLVINYFLSVNNIITIQLPG